MITIRENNLFDFIVFPGGYFDLPFQYASHLQDTQYAALQSTKVGDLLLGYGNQFLEKSTYKTVNFITNLTQQIHSDFNPESRLEGEPFQPDKTFYRKKGSCRDLSWIQNQLLRHLGIAARFVSGYYFIESEKLAHAFHVWIEVYLPELAGLDSIPAMDR